MSSHEQAPQPSEDRVTIALTPHVQQALQDLAEFPLLDAIFGRRSLRFPLGGEIPHSWSANAPGSLLVIPVADIAQQPSSNLCFFTRSGYCLFDDVHGTQVPGLAAFRDLVDVDAPLPLTFLEQYSLTEATAELATSAYAGTLLLQAMGLGGWMFDGIDRLTMLGASGDPEVPGLGFRFDTDPRWPLPNPTGLTGVFDAFAPPHYLDIAAGECSTSRSARAR